MRMITVCKQIQRRTLRDQEPRIHHLLGLVAPWSKVWDLQAVVVILYCMMSLTNKEIRTAEEIWDRDPPRTIKLVHTIERSIRKVCFRMVASSMAWWTQETRFGLLTISNRILKKGRTNRSNWIKIKLFNRILLRCETPNCNLTNLSEVNFKQPWTLPKPLHKLTSSHRSTMHWSANLECQSVQEMKRRLGSMIIFSTAWERQKKPVIDLVRTSLAYPA